MKIKNMTDHVGLWIDHRKSVIVFLEGKDDIIEQIFSDVETQRRRAAGSRPSGPFESQAVPADDRRQRDHSQRLKGYYREVMACIREAESILIMGPGEAKSELKTILEEEGLAGRIAAIETSDKMTVPQIAAHIRQYFAR